MSSNPGGNPAAGALTDLGGHSMITHYEYNRRKQLVRNAVKCGAEVAELNGEMVIQTGLQKVKTRDGIQWEPLQGLESAIDSDLAIIEDYRALTKLGKAQRALAAIDALLNPEHWLTEDEVTDAIDVGTLNAEGIREWKIDDLEEIHALVRKARMAGVFHRETEEVDS